MPDFETECMKSGGYFEVIRCEIVMGQLRRRGSPFKLSLKEAANRFSPGQSSKTVVLSVRRGHYIGLRAKGDSTESFMIANSNDHGDINWLFKKYPELQSSILEIYLVLDRQVPRMSHELLQGVSP